jgi:hypothetical protein
MYCGLAEVLSQITKQDHVRKSQIREVAFAEVLKSYKLVGFGRAFAPVRCAHPSLWLH